MSSPLAFHVAPGILIARRQEGDDGVGQFSRLGKALFGNELGEVEATLGKQLLNIAIAQGEAKVQPHGVLDDDRRKTMPAIGDRSHARSLRRTPPIQQAVFLTVPSKAIPASRPR
jgi:hypothetical protein